MYSKPLFVLLCLWYGPWVRNKKSFIYCVCSFRFLLTKAKSFEKLVNGMSFVLFMCKILLYCLYECVWVFQGCLCVCIFSSLVFTVWRFWCFCLLAFLGLIWPFFMTTCHPCFYTYYGAPILCWTTTDLGIFYVLINRDFLVLLLVGFFELHLWESWLVYTESLRFGHIAQTLSHCFCSSYSQNAKDTE